LPFSGDRQLEQPLIFSPVLPALQRDTSALPRQLGIPAPASNDTPSSASGNSYGFDE
jgi:hypothetical protein